jgi:hypothetical protein
MTDEEKQASNAAFEAGCIAPEGSMWRCLACGRISKNRMGGDTTGWDESCFLNSELEAVK